MVVIILVEQCLEIRHKVDVSLCAVGHLFVHVAVFVFIDVIK